ncbi:MAG TPA: 4Fe-4S binding protein, partial [Phycisphaerae bacterium]|nr:4Fe-4S binding protein [Phycisphaerae bacterium]
MNRLILAFVVLVLPPLVSVARGQVANRHYPSSRPPLRQTRFVELPLGAVKPQGWLRDQLRIQAEGLTGHLDEFWPDLARSAFRRPVTERYPFEKRPAPLTYRGQLHWNPEGCTGCTLCVKDCPAEAIDFFILDK